MTLTSSQFTDTALTYYCAIYASMDRYTVTKTS